LKRANPRAEKIWEKRHATSAQASSISFSVKGRSRRS
jgi:hypothetical protein